jgi:carboxypeptidase family protein
VDDSGFFQEVSVTRTFLRGLAALAIVLTFGFAPAAAQTGQMFGELVGKVTDDQGGVLPGVTVTLSGPAAMGTPTATTNAQGLYRFPAVNTGTYQLKFELAGFSPFVREQIVVPVRQTVTVDASMKLASIQETVVVSGQSPTVDIENTKVGARLSKEILEAVPTSRTIFGSTTVLPGMTMGRQDPGGLNAATSTGMTAHGAGNYNLNYYGVTADTPQNYGSMYYMDFGSAEEISVDTAAMGAEVGGGGGANINVVPKSGGNTVKGDAFYSVTGKGYWDHFTGNNITDVLRSQGVTDPSLQGLQDVNGDLGGPFVKDKLWWFGSFRNYRTIDATPGYTVVGSDGSLTNPFLSNLRNYTASGKYQINNNNQLSVFWTYNKKFQPHRNGGVTQPVPEGTLNQQSPKNLFNADWTSVFGSNTFLEVSSSYFHMHWPSDWSDEFKALSPSQQHASMYNISTSIYIDGPEPTGQRFRDAYRQQTNIGLTRYIDGFLGASHQLKTGMEYWWTPTGTDTFNIFDDYRLRVTSAADGTGCNPTDKSKCVPSEVYLFPTPLTTKTQMRNFAAFAQDRATYNRVTVNLGLRYSFYDGNIPAQGNGGSEFGAACAACNQSYPEIHTPYSWKTFAPRTGVVIKLTEDGKNVAKASYSRYYEVMYTTEYSSINGNAPVGTGTSGGGVATYSWNGQFTANGLPVLGTLKNQFVARSNVINPNLKDPRDDEIMVAYQRELAPNWSLSVDWLQRWFNDQTINQDCYGLPCNLTASTAYIQNKAVHDFGPDNLNGTGDDRDLLLWQVAPAYVGKDTFYHTNCGDNVSVSCTQQYRAFELVVNKRMSNKWQMQGSYVWSRNDGDLILDYTNPNNLLSFIGQGRTTTDQPHAFKLLGSYQAPYGITIGANYQALSGLPTDRLLSVSYSQGTSNTRMDSVGTYRADTLSLLSLRVDKSFRFGVHRISPVIELHNVLNSSASQNNIGTVTRGFASQTAFDNARLTTSYFGRVQEIVAPRVLKIGFKYDF